jgi:hypothetical protein
MVDPVRSRHLAVLQFPLLAVAVAQMLEYGQQPKVSAQHLVGQVVVVLRMQLQRVTDRLELAE